MAVAVASAAPLPAMAMIGGVRCAADVSREPYQHRTAELGLRVDVSGIRAVLEVLDEA